MQSPTHRPYIGWVTQDELIDILRSKYPIGRNTLSSIENGNAAHFELSLLAAMCEIFECEIGFLLCEYDCTTKEFTDIQRSTGLSESAISMLCHLNQNEKKFLNRLLEDSANLYFIAAGFADFTRKKALNQAIDEGLIDEDFGPDTLCIKNDLDYARFTLMNRFMLFAEK